MNGHEIEWEFKLLEELTIVRGEDIYTYYPVVDDYRRKIDAGLKWGDKVVVTGFYSQPENRIVMFFQGCRGSVVKYIVNIGLHELLHWAEDDDTFSHDAIYRVSEQLTERI